MNCNDLLLRLRALSLKRRLDLELEEELASHIELQARKHRDAGMTPDDALRRARLDFGAIESAKEECRDARRVTWFLNVAQDLHYALRVFRQAPGFTAVVICMLALGMGADLSTFSVADALLLRLLPVKDPGSLFRTAPAGGNAYDSGNAASFPLYKEMQKRTSAVADLMVYQPAEAAPVSIAHFEQERVMQQMVSSNYFQVLGVRAIAGRVIASEEDEGRQAVAVISYRLWKSKFDRDISAIGSKLRSGDHVFEVIGVAPQSFFGVEVGKIVDVWTPATMASSANLTSNLYWLRTMGRVKPGVTIAQAVAPMQAVVNAIMLEDVRLHAPPGTPKQIIEQFLAGTRIKGVPAGGGISFLRRQYEQPLRIVMFVVGLVLLIACSNVANLLIAKGSARQQEIAIRLSLGAGRQRILQQLITESLLLALVSATAGLLLTHWMTPAFIRLLTPSSAPAELATSIDERLLTAASIFTFVTVVICGLLPAFRLSSTDAQTALKNGARLSGHGRVRKLLAASQVALSLVLVMGALLFTRTLVNLMSSSLGFNPNNILVTRISAQAPGDGKSLAPGWSELLRGVRTLPGVAAASLSSASLFSGGPGLTGIRTTAAKAAPADPVTGELFISPGYFDTLGIPFVSGRDFETRDYQADSERFAIVNEAFARKFFGTENPIGRRLTRMANAPLWTGIAGIVRDAKYNSLRETAPPMIYIPYSRITDWIAPQAHPELAMSLQMRAREGLLPLAADLRRQAGPRFTVGQVLRQQQFIDDTFVRERLLAKVAGLFAVLALLLVALGLFGIMSYAVAQRRQELGLRMALGAAPQAIVRLMLQDSAAVVGVGIAGGILAALSTARLAKALLFGLTPNDPGTLFMASAVLLIASLAAAFIPAYRAARTSPLIALRHE